MGLMSRVKSICPLADGVSLETSTLSGAATHRAQEKSKMPQPTFHAGEGNPRWPGGGFISIEKERLSVGAVNRGVATGRPTGPKTEEPAVVHITD